MKVSVWAGTTRSWDVLDGQLSFDYTEDGDAIPSPFCEAFGISWFDEDFREASHSEHATRNLSHLLKRHSKGDQIAAALGKSLMLKDACNAVVVLYEFEYSGVVQSAKIGEETTLHFLGCVALGALSCSSRSRNLHYDWREHVHSDFQRPSEEDFRNVERELGKNIPQELRAFITQHNQAFFEGIPLFRTKASPDNDAEAYNLQKISGVPTNELEAEHRSLRGNARTYYVDQSVPTRFLGFGTTFQHCVLCISTAPPDEGAIYLYDPELIDRPADVPSMERMRFVAPNLETFLNSLEPDPVFDVD